MGGNGINYQSSNPATGKVLQFQFESLEKLTDGKYVTLDEYKTRNADKTKNKVFYASDPKRQAASIDLYTQRGIDVAVLDFKEIDSSFMNFMEYGGGSKPEETLRFARVDADVSGLTEESEEGKELNGDALQELFRKALGKENLSVTLAPMANADLIAVATEDETMRRMKELYRMKDMPAEYSLVLNRRNATIAALAARSADDELTQLLCKQIYDIARMSAAPLEADQITDFLTRSQKLLSMMV